MLQNVSVNAQCYPCIHRTCKQACSVGDAARRAGGGTRPVSRPWCSTTPCTWMVVEVLGRDAVPREGPGAIDLAVPAGAGRADDDDGGGENATYSPSLSADDDDELLASPAQRRSVRRWATSPRSGLRTCTWRTTCCSPTASSTNIWASRKPTLLKQ